MTRSSIPREPWDCQSATQNHWFRTLRSRLCRCWCCLYTYHWPAKIHSNNSSPENRTRFLGVLKSFAFSRELTEGACVRALAPHRGAVRTSLEVREFSPRDLRAKEKTVPINGGRGAGKRRCANQVCLIVAWRCSWGALGWNESCTQRMTFRGKWLVHARFSLLA